MNIVGFECDNKWQFLPSNSKIVDKTKVSFKILKNPPKMVKREQVLHICAKRKTATPASQGQAFEKKRKSLTFVKFYDFLGFIFTTACDK